MARQGDASAGTDWDREPLTCFLIQCDGKLVNFEYKHHEHHLIIMCLSVLT